MFRSLPLRPPAATRPRFARWHALLCLGLTTVALLTAPRAARAETPSWERLGPYGGTVYSLAVDPTSPEVLFAGTSDRGVFKTVDGGMSWSHAGLDHMDVYALAVDPTDPGVVLAATSRDSVLRSADGGATWQATAGLPGYAIYALEFNPADHRVVFAGTNYGVYRSSDTGIAWARAAAPADGFACYAVRVDPSTPSTIYAGGFSNDIYKSTDGGLAWSRFPAAPTSSLAIDPSNPARLYAAGPNGVYTSSDAGQTWRSTSGVFNVFSVAVDPANPRRLYAGVFFENGLLISEDAGASWRPADPSLACSPVNAVVASPGGGLYAATGGAGVFRSDDAGRSWRRLVDGFDALSVWSMTFSAADPALVLLGTSGGVFRSTDRGRTFVYSGLYSVRSIAPDPANPSHFYAGSAGGGLAKSTDGGRTWSRVGGDLPDRFFRSVAVDPSTPMRVFAAANAARLYRSEDGGRTFELVYDGEGAYTGEILPVATSPLTLVFATDAYVTRSIDGGSTWQMNAPGDLVIDWLALAADPSAPTTLYAAGYDGAYVSKDAGATWARERGYTFSYFGSDVAVNPALPGTAYASTVEVGRALYETTDGGGSWRPFAPSAENAHIFSLAVDAAGQYLYAGTQRGLLRCSLSHGESCSVGGSISWNREHVSISFSREGGGQAPPPVITDSYGRWRQGGFLPGAVYRATASAPGLRFKPKSVRVRRATETITFKVRSAAKNFAPLDASPSTCTSAGALVRGAFSPTRLIAW